VLAEAGRKVVHVHRYRHANPWPTVTYLAGQEMMLESLAICVPVDALYTKVLLPRHAPHTE
jgi:hypothetical protein